MGLGAWGLGLGVWGLGFGVWGLGFSGLGLRVALLFRGYLRLIESVFSGVTCSTDILL